MATRDYSDKQEKQIASYLDGVVQTNSGGTKFGGGDVITEHFLIEAKTPTTKKQSFSIKQKWVEKMDEQAFEQGCRFSALAFRFDPEDDNDYFVINRRSMEEFVWLLRYMEENS